MGSVVGCALLLPLIAAGIRLFGFHRTGAFLAGVWPPRARTGPTAPSRWRRARRIARRVETAARYGPYPARCLERALLLWWLLGRRGIETRLRMGVRKAGDRLQAHAWVELAGRSLETGALAGGLPHDALDRDFAPGRPHG